MGIRIEAVATSVPESGGTLEMLIPLFRRHRHKKALILADEAAKKCLEKAGHESSEVELLINVGIYRYKNLGEPALASMIQEDIGADPGTTHSKHLAAGEHGTFSFDLANGGCGIINGFQIMDRFIRSGMLELGMIVASDCDPTPENLTSGYAHPAAGGAVLLSPGKEGEGFRGFHFENYPEFESMHESRVAWQDNRFHLPFSKGGKRGGKNVFSVKEAPGYLARCVECTEASLEKFLKLQHLSLQEIDLIITSQYPVEFPDVLEQHLQLPGDHVARVSESFAGAFTAAPLIGIDSALRSGRFQKAHRILFITVTAGISVGLALYENPAI